MIFNVNKCYALHITHKKKPLHTSYFMNGSPLQIVQNHTYLGLNINDKLSWANHINITCTKANQVLGLVRRNFYSCSPHVKDIVYKTIVRPKLEYCASIWDPYQQTYKDKLEAVQRRAARFVCKEYRRSYSVSAMIAKLAWSSLENRRAATRLTLLYKSINKKVAIDVDSYIVQPGQGVNTRRTCAVSCRRPYTTKDWYK